MHAANPPHRKPSTVDKGRLGAAGVLMLGHRELGERGVQWRKPRLVRESSERRGQRRKLQVLMLLRSRDGSACPSFPRDLVHNSDVLGKS